MMLLRYIKRYQAEIFSTYAFKHALSISLAVLFAAIANYIFYFSEEAWACFAAFLVSQTTRGTSFRQAFIFFTVLIFALLLAGFLVQFFSATIVHFILALIFIVSSALVFLNRVESNRSIYLIMYFAIVLCIMTLVPPTSGNFLHQRMVAILIGGGIGLLCSQLFFPFHLAQEFRQGMLPLITSLSHYLTVLTNAFLQRENAREVQGQARAAMEKALTSQFGAYPNWVYEVGFNPGLRAGLRYFLVHLERITEIFFSLDFQVTQGVRADIVTPLTENILEVTANQQLLLTMLLNYFNDATQPQISADFTSDLLNLETAAQRLLPPHLELLDLSPDYMVLTAFIRDCKDLRTLLLQLVSTLPTPNPRNTDQPS